MSNKRQQAAETGEKIMFSFAQKKRFNRGIGGLILSATLLSSAVLTTTASASGSFGGGAGIGAHSSYNLGKSIFHKKLSCNACPANGIQMNRKGAKKLINDLEMDHGFASSLNTKSRKAVIAYLTRRFKVN